MRPTESVTARLKEITVVNGVSLPEPFYRACRADVYSNTLTKDKPSALAAIYSLCNAYVSDRIGLGKDAIAKEIERTITEGPAPNPSHVTEMRDFLSQWQGLQSLSTQDFANIAHALGLGTQALGAVAGALSLDPPVTLALESLPKRF